MHRASARYRTLPICARMRSFRPTMKPSPSSHASLRTKTGCLTCRQRRKKCDEQRPKCACCVASKRACTWPTIDLLTDRRNRPRNTILPKSSANRRNVEQAKGATCLVPAKLPISLAESEIALRTLGTDLEVAIARHFVDDFYPHLISLDCDQQFRLEWLHGIQESMPHCAGLRYSVLANAASHLFLAGQSLRMQDLALHYYTCSLRGLSTAISRSDASEWRCGGNAILTSMIFLYLHGNMGNGTYDDTSTHVNAAVQVLERRFFQPGAEIDLQQPTDRLMVESVIYQIFQLEMGFWSDDREKCLPYQFDPRFWLKCENLLRSSSKFPELPDASSSPVLGIPMAIYKLMLMIRRLWTMDPRPPDFYILLSQLEIELDSWKQAESLEPQNEKSTATCQPPLLAPSNTIVGHATMIMVICASLVLNQLRSQPSGCLVAPVNDECGGQVERMMSILRYRKGDQRWTSCHVATYPVYVAGYFTRSKEEIDLVRADMQQRFENLHWGQVSRYWEDLETIWRMRSRRIPKAN
jgi:hypothetical protein